MYGIMLCDWTTVRGVTATSPITQGEDQWLDLTAFTDCVFWIDVRETTGTVTLAIETAPTKDEAYFKTVATMTATVAAAPIAILNLVHSATVPVARWVRWKLSSATATWDVTMRIWVSANAPGG